VQAVDTNVLVYAEIEGSPHHETARTLLSRMAESATPWAIPWPCVYEFLKVVTHPRVFDPPMPQARALADLNRILASPSLVLLRQGPRHAEVMERVIRASGATGNLVHDAHIVALCLESGANQLITGDRDFSRFSEIELLNPFA
jgi:toxin-antitoxin system PIN domain toxin